MAYYITNLKKLYNVVGDGIHNLLQDFECPLNGDVEYFFKHKSIEFSKQGLAETFVVFSSYKDENVIVGYFSLTNKTTKIKKDVLKGKTKKRMSRFAQFDDGGKYFYVSLPLIGQIGKNYFNNYNKLISGFVCFGKRNLEKDERQKNSGEYLLQMLCDLSNFNIKNIK